MARIRTIKPDFWSDERMAEVSRDARLLFIGLLNLADDFGVLRDSHRYLKGQLFPYDDLDLLVLLEELVRIGRVVRFHHNGEGRLFIRNFTKHQKLDTRVQPKLGLPPGYIIVRVPGDDGKMRTEVQEDPAAHHSPPTPTNSRHSVAEPAETRRSPPESGAPTPSLNTASAEPANSRQLPPTPAPGREGKGREGTGPERAGARGVSASTSTPGDCLRDRMEAVWLEKRGHAYAWTHADDAAVRPLLQKAGGDEAEVLRRWGLALDTAFPRCTGVTDLARHWNAYAAPEAPRPGGRPAGDVRRGVVRAEDALARMEPPGEVKLL